MQAQRGRDRHDHQCSEARAKLAEETCLTCHSPSRQGKGERDLMPLPPPPLRADRPPHEGKTNPGPHQLTSRLKRRSGGDKKTSPINTGHSPEKSLLLPHLNQSLHNKGLSEGTDGDREASHHPKCNQIFFVQAANKAGVHIGTAAAVSHIFLTSVLPVDDPLAAGSN